MSELGGRLIGTTVRHPPTQTELLMQLLHEQRQTNHILTMLIDALAEEDIASSDEPLRYMDGSPYV